MIPPAPVLKSRKSYPLPRSRRMRSSMLSILARRSRFCFNETPTTEIYTLSLHDALPIAPRAGPRRGQSARRAERGGGVRGSWGEGDARNVRDAQPGPLQRRPRGVEPGLGERGPFIEESKQGESRQVGNAL